MRLRVKDEQTGAVTKNFIDIDDDVTLIVRVVSVF